ncbi:hypothetical protein JTE90_024844 [Oedothorax gibbosus]|uniref:Transposase Tc1-like domain-containing protein n=1 Tax=Oedothorax gibbosus TaxID=931172 RepID=A0AAV6UAA9_9ARAC|nr:hypothetical protein JTE90_024844 [Oedothorax gibbosus]
MKSAPNFRPARGRARYALVCEEAHCRISEASQLLLSHKLPVISLRTIIHMQRRGSRKNSHERSVREQVKAKNLRWRSLDILVTYTNPNGSCHSCKTIFQVTVGNFSKHP